MSIQTSSFGNLEAAQNLVISEARYTSEANAPCKQLIENIKLDAGASTYRVPKVGQFTMSPLVEGIDITTTQDIGLQYTDLTWGEVGGMVILTDKLTRQFNESTFKMVGRQLGDAMARYYEDEIIALFLGLNGGTTLGGDNINFTLRNATAVAAFGAANLYKPPVSIVHHPNALAFLARSAAGIGQSGYAGLNATTKELLANYFVFDLNGTSVYQSGNIDKITGYDSGYGAIFSMHSMACIESLKPKIERQRDASLRAWEVIMVADTGFFELDDLQGAPLRYEIGNLTTASTST
jgi:hypothetical protein